MKNKIHKIIKGGIIPALMLLSSTNWAQLSGVYTIGGANPNYNTFNQSVANLNLQGISDSTTFRIRNGIYYETIVIDSIQGASPNSPVIFESESGDSCLVILQGDSIVPAGYILKVNAASYLVFNSITFKNSGGNDTLVNLDGGASHDRFLK
ncbi:MAG: hypothetical protein K1X82_14845 [Bacteroidia bacterium]|nr:hypothetical protein [Bacteroidia bacterium]